MKILNIHGLNGSNTNTNYKLLCSEFPGAEIVSPQIDYESNSPEDILANLKSLCPNPDLIVGNSFGGFFAYILGSCTGTKTLLVNPCIPPDKYIPNLVSGYRFKESLLALWSTYADTNSNYFVILGNEDKVLDINTTLFYLKPKENEMAIVKGGHSLKGEEFIKAFKEGIR